MENRLTFKDGIKKGLPIGLGYIPVSFTFGLTAVKFGIPVLLAIFTSLSNLSSAGQFAGTNLIIAGATYLEIALTTLVVNMRYMLMSLALSQKLESGIPLRKRLLFGFGITDEVFAVASMETLPITSSYMFGLIILPILGWTIGTALGACTSEILPPMLQNAFGIALYTMFIAIIIPPAKKSKSVLLVIGLSVALTCLFYYVPFFSFISDGFKIIIATLVSSSIAAWLFPIKDGNAEV